MDSVCPTRCLLASTSLEDQPNTLLRAVSYSYCPRDVSIRLRDHFRRIKLQKIQMRSRGSHLRGDYEIPDGPDSGFCLVGSSGRPLISHAVPSLKKLATATLVRSGVREARREIRKSRIDGRLPLRRHANREIAFGT